MSEKPKKKNLNVTRTYSLFHHDINNRPLDLPGHAVLRRLMEKHGFLSDFPIVCVRRNQKLFVKDGQHRLAFAQELGLPVWWVESEETYDVSEIQSSIRTWKLSHYAGRWANAGYKDYQECLDFAERHGLNLNHAASLLAGHVNISTVREAFHEGKFQVKDRQWAEAVARLYNAISALEKSVRTGRFLEACMAACRVPEFEPERFVHNAKRCRDRLISYATRDAFLDMIEEIYNKGRHSLLGVKAAATMAMRERNPANKNGNGQQ